MVKFFHCLIVIVLTLLTQIGGLVYGLTFLLVRKHVRYRLLQRIVVFLLCYLTLTYWVVPYLAPQFGREMVIENNNISAKSWLYKLTNRNYVTPELNQDLQSIAAQFSSGYPGIRVMYLDANFPFIDGFPLLPHLSHNDGKKIDLTLVYQNSSGEVVNFKPSNSGYGVFESPREGEYDQIAICKAQGNFLYDYPKYLTLGVSPYDLVFAESATRHLLRSIVERNRVEKVFIEPHFKQRLGPKSR